MPWAHIDYLVGYESSNIFHIWVTYLKKVIIICDVTFDKTRQYNPNETELTMVLWEEIEQIVELIELPSSDYIYELPGLNLKTSY